MKPQATPHALRTPACTLHAPPYMLHPTCCMLHPTGCTLQYRTTPYALGPTTSYAVNPTFYKRGAGEAGKLKITDIQSLQNFFLILKNVFFYTLVCILLHKGICSLTGEVDKLTIHAGTKPLGGEKWVATKWIHQRRYQVQHKHRRKE